MTANKNVPCKFLTADWDYVIAGVEGQLFLAFEIVATRRRRHGNANEGFYNE